MLRDRWDYWRDPNPAQYFDMTHSAAVDLVADRDALAAENAQLHEALRKEQVRREDDGYSYCYQCDSHWHETGPEHHASGCLAALKGNL